MVLGLLPGKTMISKPTTVKDKENESKFSSISTRTDLGMNLNVFYIWYRSIITLLLHTSPCVAPRAVRVESAKSYRGKLRFHVTGRGFSTRRLVAFHDTWHFHETSYRGISSGIFTRPVVVALKSQWLVKAFTVRNLFTIELF